MRLEHERLDPVVAQPLVAAGELLEELDARDLEPDEVVRVVRDALRVGLGEAHLDRCREAEAVHAARMLRGGALDGLLVEDPGAGLADLLLDLVRDACLLREHVHTLGDVLVDGGYVLCVSSSESA